MANLANAFHFAQPVWLWALLLCVPVALWLLLGPGLAARNERVQEYADSHLLPHLLGKSEAPARTRWMRFARWTALWSMLVLAMAGPRWDFTDVELFRPGTNLLVLVDISQSMNVSDVKPSRIARARQEVEDLLDRSRGIRVGLIAYASVAHVISPITEDTKAIGRMLTALDTSLVRLQGSRLTFALERAEQILAGQPEESSNSLLIISDGDFDEEGLESRVRTLAESGVNVHVLGIGTPEGDAVPGLNNPRIMGRSGKPIISALNEGMLKSLASAGNGIYLRADYRDGDTREILDQVKAQALPRSGSDEHTRVWNERFYWLAGLALLLVLPLFRRTQATFKHVEQ